MYTGEKTALTIKETTEMLFKNFKIYIHYIVSAVYKSIFLIVLKIPFKVLYKDHFHQHSSRIVYKDSFSVTDTISILVVYKDYFRVVHQHSLPVVHKNSLPVVYKDLFSKMDKYSFRSL